MPRLRSCLVIPILGSHARITLADPSVVADPFGFAQGRLSVSASSRRSQGHTGVADYRYSAMGNVNSYNLTSRSVWKWVQQGRVPARGHSLFHIANEAREGHLPIPIVSRNLSSRPITGRSGLRGTRPQQSPHTRRLPPAPDRVRSLQLAAREERKERQTASESTRRR
jgi:hypothetical protein